MVRNIRITIDDDDAKLLDEVRDIEKVTYADLLLLSIENKRKVKSK